MLVGGFFFSYFGILIMGDDFMCTAITYNSDCHYFGRNLDLETGFGERIVITQRNYKLNLRKKQPLRHHFAMIGTAAVIEDYPLYFEATNEDGLSMAGLNFPNNAHYKPFSDGDVNICPFELIPYVLGCCSNCEEAIKRLKKINLVNIDFSEQLPLSPLHWIMADRDNCYTIESVFDGLKIYDNPVGILTNNPPFPFHLANLSNYSHLTAKINKRPDWDNEQFDPYSLGTGAIGLPGDFSSASRFVKAYFVKELSPSFNEEEKSVAQFFHILSSVAMPKGSVLAANGDFEYTRYSCCCNTDTGVYYYKTYDDNAIKAVDMSRYNLNGSELIII